MLHFALTGQVPYPREADEARLWAHLHAAPPEPSRVAPGVPAAFDAIVRHALEKRPESAVFRRRAGRAPRSPPPAPRRAATRGPRRRRRARRATAVTWPDGPRAALDAGEAIAAVALIAAAAGAVAAVAFATAGRGGLRPRRPRRPAGDRSRAGEAAGRQGARRPAPHVIRTIPVGVRPVNVEVAAGSAWVASTGTPTLDRVPSTARLAIAVRASGIGITDVADRRGELWVTVAVPREVVRVRASTGHPIGHPIAMIGEPRAIDAGEGAVWVAEQSPRGPDNLVEIDPHTATVVGRVAIPEGINDIRAANGAVWVLGRRAPDADQGQRGDPPADRAHRVGRHAERVDVAAGYVWVTDYGDDEVTRVDPKGPKLVRIAVPGRPYGLHARDDGVWVACYGDQSVVRIDPRTGRVVGKPIRVGFNPVAVDVRGHSVWVTSVADNRLTRIDFARGRGARARRRAAPAAPGRTLLVLGQVADAEEVEERAHRALHGVDAQRQLARDRRVRGRRGERRIAVGPAERDEDAALGRGQDVADRDALGGQRRIRARARSRRAEGQRGAPDADDVAVAQAAAGRHALLVDPRAVAREAVVGDRPVAAQPLERRVRARHARVPRQRHVGRLVAPDRQLGAVAGELDDDLPVVLVAQDEERRGRRLRAQALAQLGGRGDVGAAEAFRPRADATCAIPLSGEIAHPMGARGSTPGTDGRGRTGRASLGP